MAAIPHVSTLVGGFGGGPDVFQPIGCGAVLLNNLGDVRTRIRYRSPGTISKLFINVLANTRPASGTVTIQINGSPGSSVITIPANTIGHFEAAGTDAIAAGDDVNVEVVRGAGSGAFSYDAIGCLFAADTDSVTRYVHIETGTHGGGTSHMPIAGAGVAGSVSTTGDDVWCTFQTAGTLRNAAVKLATNTRDDDSTFVLWVDGAATAISVNFAAGVTGTIEDTTHTADVAVGSRAKWVLTVTGLSGVIAASWKAIDLVTVNDQAMFYETTFRTYSAAGTSYLSVMGSGQSSATLADAEHRLQMAGALSRLRFRISNNTSPGTLTVTLVINGVDGNSTFTIPAGGIGDFEDIEHFDAIAATDLVALKIVTTSGTGGITMVLAGLLWGISVGELNGLLFCDPFSHYTGPQRLRMYSSESAGGTIATGPYGPAGQSGIRFSGSQGDYLERTLSAASAKAVLQSDFRISAGPSARVIISEFLYFNSSQVSLNLNADRTLQIFRGVTPISSPSSYVVPLNTRIYLAWKANMLNPTGLVVVHVYQAGDVTPRVVLSISGVNAQGAALPQWDRFRIYATSDGDTDYSHLVVLDAGGPRLNDLLGPVDVWALWSNNRIIGTTQQFQINTGVDHVAVLDDVTPDDDLTYAFEASDGAIEETYVDPIPFPDREILGMQPMPCIKTGAIVSGAVTVAVGVQQAATLTFPHEQTPPTDWKFLREPMDKMPDSSVFGAAAFDALQWPVRISTL